MIVYLHKKEQYCREIEVKNRQDEMSSAEKPMRSLMNIHAEVKDDPNKGAQPHTTFSWTCLMTGLPQRPPDGRDYAPRGYPPPDSRRYPPTPGSSSRPMPPYPYPRRDERDARAYYPEPPPRDPYGARHGDSYPGYDRRESERYAEWERYRQQSERGGRGGGGGYRDRREDERVREAWDDYHRRMNEHERERAAAWERERDRDRYARDGRGGFEPRDRDRGWEGRRGPSRSPPRHRGPAYPPEPARRRRPSTSPRRSRSRSLSPRARARHTPSRDSARSPPPTSGQSPVKAREAEETRSSQEPPSTRLSTEQREEGSIASPSREPRLSSEMRSPVACETIVPLAQGEVAVENATPIKTEVQRSVSPLDDKTASGTLSDNTPPAAEVKAEPETVARPHPVSVSSEVEAPASSRDKGKGKEVLVDPVVVPETDGDGDVKMAELPTPNPAVPTGPRNSTPSGPRARSPPRRPRLQQIDLPPGTPTGPASMSGPSPSQAQAYASASPLQPFAHLNAQQHPPRAPHAMMASPNTLTKPSFAGRAEWGRRGTGGGGSGPPLTGSNAAPVKPGQQQQQQQQQGHSQPVATTTPVLPKIPKFVPPESITKALDLELVRLQTHRAHLATEHPAISRAARRAMHELDLAAIDLRMAEERRKVADTQFELAKAGMLGIDAVRAAGEAVGVGAGGDAG